jgi:hypothetical protein
MSKFACQLLYRKGSEKDFGEGRRKIKYWKPNIELEKWSDQLIEITPNKRYTITNSRMNLFLFFKFPVLQCYPINRITITTFVTKIGYIT